MKRFQITYQVQGGVSFPLDMLRYDQSWPETEVGDNGSYAIERSVNHESDGPVTIRLRHNGPRDWYPTEGRWESFGWKVLEGSVELGPALL